MEHGKKQYRFTTNCPTGAMKSPPPGVKVYVLLEQDPNNEVVWSPLRAKNETPSFVDPNQLNKEKGLPPYYELIPVGEDGKEWVEKYFSEVRIVRDYPSDIIFEGRFKGYVSEQKAEEKTETVSSGG